MILAFISFIGDGIVSLLINQNSLFVPLLAIMSLIVIYPRVKNKQSIVMIGGILGLLYDIVYTQTPFFNTILFICLALVVLVFYKYVPINIVNSYVLAILLISLFRICSYLILVLFFDLSFNWNVLFKSIYSSLIINIIYLTVVPFILNKIMGRKKKRKLIKI